MASPNEGGVEALQHLKSVDPPLFLSPSPLLSQATRLASKYLFSSLHPFCPKSPFNELLVKGFDAEQIWQQIDLQTNPLLLNLQRELKHLEKNPEEISKLFEGKIIKKDTDLRKEVLEKKSCDFEEEDESFEDMEDDEVSGGSEEEEEDEEGEEEEDEDDDEDEEDEEQEGGDHGGIEDKFLKIKELEEYMEDDEAREYGVPKEKKRVNKDDEEEEDDDDDEDSDDEDEDDEIGGFGVDADEDDDELGNARYEDFFGRKKEKVTNNKKSVSHDELEDLDTDNEEEDEKGFGDQKGETLSTHEKQAQKLRAEIKEMEKANMEPKKWTLQGEVTATKRPKNSALEVDLDFEHNVRPAPVITEEVTASLEDLIKKRVLEGHFNDVQKAPSLPSSAPKELNELDENKSKKGLAEIYAAEYMQTTNQASAPLSFSDEQKKEASLLFKKLSLKLDALSHFHFTPKPVIEDMSIQANVPALAMEEVAPIAVSDVAMLAPEEVFGGKGDIKEEAELSQADRKRRRANKKRKFKAETAKRMENKKAPDNSLPNHSNGKEEP